jgi:hypothetical protein
MQTKTLSQIAKGWQATIGWDQVPVDQKVSQHLVE